MKSIKSASLILTLLAGSLLACNLPILKHADADDLTSNPLSGNCPLSFPKSKLCGSLEWLTPPSLDEEKPGSARLRFWNSETSTASGPYVNPDTAAPGTKVNVKLWMPDMGHGSAPVKIGTSKDAQGNAVTGVFDTQEVYFSMSGHWEIFIQLKQGASVTEQAKLDVTL